MNRLKDFFYNKNDIVIALIILIVASTIIYFKVQAITDYPAVLAESQKSNTHTVEPSPVQPQ